jgi:ribosome-binding protein aMBF1 (putative translation factor)
LLQHWPARGATACAIGKKRHLAAPVKTPAQHRSAGARKKLRNDAGLWLRRLREKRGLSQRELAKKVGAEYYTLISQLEHGCGRIPPEDYLIWAKALAVAPGPFVRRLMSYYDPVTYDIIFS